MITIVIGTNRPQAVSEIVAYHYQSILSSLNQESRILDLKGLPADFTFSALYDNEGQNEAFNAYRAWMEESQKIIFIIPEYNVSYPGVLKAFIDGMKYPGTFNGKICGLTGVSAGPLGGSLAISHFNDIASYLGMYVVPTKPYLGNIYSNISDNKITNEVYLNLMKEQVEELIKQ